jgi:uncharacterized protein (DUF427 family)
MPVARWNGQVVAEAEGSLCETVEGNVYFPPQALRPDFFRPSSTTTRCPWKGTASYYHVVVDGRENRDAAWFYPDPKPAAASIRGKVAFWRGVEVGS